MTRDGTRPPTTRYGYVELEMRADPGKPPPTGPKDTRPPRGPVQPSRPNPRDPDSLPDPRPGRVLAVVGADPQPAPQPGTPWPGGPPEPDGGWPRPTGRTPLPVVALWLLAPGLIVFGGWAGGVLLTWWAG